MLYLCNACNMLYLLCKFNMLYLWNEFNMLYLKLLRIKKGMLKEWKKACWKMVLLNPACWNCCRKKRHVEGIKTACWKMVLLNSACWKKIRHVETATDKKRHVEVKSGMLKINKACWKKRHVPAQKFLLMSHFNACPICLVVSHTCVSIFIASQTIPWKWTKLIF